MHNNIFWKNTLYRTQTVEEENLQTYTTQSWAKWWKTLVQKIHQQFWWEFFKWCHNWWCFKYCQAWKRLGKKWHLLMCVLFLILKFLRISPTKNCGFFMKLWNKKYCSKKYMYVNDGVVTSVSLKFVVNSIVYYYCVYYEF